ncbi:MAG: hypothetical protein R3281_10155 [Balneolaceae bacterium]|nr:hypothetical protein [Balneolaceae bacterium]
MNTAYITSFVIGGMVLLSILTMNFSISQNSTELALSRNLKQHVTTISEMVSHDISKIGYNWMGKINNPIQTADSNKIVFESNIDNDSGNTAELVTWTFGNTALTSTDNPNDYVLRRLVVQGLTTISSTDITFGVTKFRLKYYSTAGSNTPMPTPVLNPEDIEQIEIELVVESGKKFSYNVNGTGRYIKSTWHKRFSPINLQDN